MNNFESSMLSDEKNLSLLQAMRILFDYPYMSFISQFISRTREFERGLVMVDICRDLLSKYESEIPTKEAQNIEKNVTFLELSLYDDLNRWQDYLDLFEQIFQTKRSVAYILTYSVANQKTAEERFGRYLLGHNKTGFQVHSLYLCESRKAVIERKLMRQQEGKNVEHLKRHQKDRLTLEEQNKRFVEMQELFEMIAND